WRRWWPRALFFFSSRRRHTSSDRDWSSDVCSSDLVWEAAVPSPAAERPVKAPALSHAQITVDGRAARRSVRRLLTVALLSQARKIGRASCRERVWFLVGAVAVFCTKTRWTFTCRKL